MPFLALVVVVVIKTMVVAVVIVESVNFSFIVGVFSDVGDVLDVVDGSDEGVMKVNLSCLRGFAE